MMKLKIIVIYLVGFFLGPIGDYFHVRTNTTGYPDEVFRFYFFGLPFWVPLLFGGAALFVGVSHPWLDRYLTPKHSRIGTRSAGIAIFGLLWFLGLYLLSGFLPGPAGGRNDAIMAGLAILTWAALDRTWSGVLLGALTALLGSLVEISLVQMGAFYYLPDCANLWGVASWLPWLYFAASVCIGNFGRYLLAPKFKT